MYFLHSCNYAVIAWCTLLLNKSGGIKNGKLHIL